MARPTLLASLAFLLVLCCLQEALAQRTLRNVTPSRQQQILEKRFAQVDRDKDKIITLKELKRHRRKQFRDIDDNRDDILQEGEYMQMQSDRVNKRLSQPTFDDKRRQYYRIDRNHDKRVTMAEFEVASLVQFRILDANRNGEISWEEFSRPPFPSTNKRSGR